MHFLLELLLTRPQLLVDHAQAYAGLFNEELDQVLTSWRRQVMLQAATLCCLGISAALAGGAAMLWAVIPASQIHTPWVLFVIPLLPLAMAVLCLFRLRGLATGDAFETLGRQLNADMSMLRAASLS